MRETRYLIVGGGMAAHAAATALRELDPGGSIALLGEEPTRPYARPPLSKGLWLGKGEESVYLPEVPGLELRTGCRAVALDAARRELEDDRGEVHRFEKLLLATGAAPRRLPLGGGDDAVVYFRTLADYRRLRAAPGRRVVVIGGGFIGSELAAALAQAGREVTMVFPEPAICGRVFPPDLAAAVTAAFRDRGVTIVEGEIVTAVERRGEEIVVRTGAGEELVAEVAVAGLGVRPRTDLAEEAGLRCADGVLVDAFLQTSAEGIFAAGDVARFPCPPLGGPVRVEHEDAALTMGRTAGRNMAGARERYEHLPSFYSDLFDAGYEAVGRLDARLETVASWATPYREGVVYYLDEHDRVAGVLLWGTFGKVDAARELVERSGPVRRETLHRGLGPSGPSPSG
jgi:NADPH-dependent 2,4-dienoyl-CoA reductase/sulfur reductase-like enzyme